MKLNVQIDIVNILQIIVPCNSGREINFDKNFTQFNDFVRKITTNEEIKEKLLMDHLVKL